MDRSSVGRWPLTVVAAAVIAWLGMYVHNVADLPGQSIVSPETLVPTLITLVLVVVWFIRPVRHAATWALLVWAWISLIGGIISVLPLGMLPFEPAQTPTHYGFHAIYAATQIPLIVVTMLWLRDRRRAVLPESGVESPAAE